MIRFTPDIPFQKKLIYWSQLFLIAIIGIATLVLFGWAFSIEVLKHPVPGYVAMNPLTCICFLLLGIVFIAKQRNKTNVAVQRIAAIICLSVMVVSGWKILALTQQSNYILDQLLFAQKVNTDVTGGFTNNMAPNTAFCFLMCAGAIICTYNRHRFAILLSQLSNVLVLLVAVFSILGYVFGAEEFYEVQNFIPMAIHSAICFFMLALALFFAVPDQGIMQQFTSIYSGSFVAWRLLIPAFLLPIFIGLFRLWGQRSGLYNLEFGSALFVTSMILVFLALIWMNTLLLNRREFNQEEIVAEKNYLANLVEQTSDAVLSTDVSLNIKSWNKGAEEIYGFKKEEILGKPLGSFLKSDLDPETSQRLLIDLNNKGYYNAEYVFYDKYNQPIYVQASVTVLKDKFGSITGYVAVHRDISERRQLEQQLREFNQQLEQQVLEKTTELREVFERISDAFLGVDNQYQIVYANKKAELLFGNDAKQLLGSEVHHLFSDQDGEAAVAIRQAFETREYVYLEAWLDKFKKWFELNIYPSASGLSVYLRDISTRKNALLELHSSEEKYRLFFENSLDGILLTNSKGEIYAANPAACEIFGMTEEEICTGGRIAILDESDPNWAVFFEERSRTGKAKAELRHFRKDGTVFLAEVASVKFRNASGETRTNTIIRDITERKRAEAEVQESYEQIRRLTAHLQNVREEERTHIAREIHDELGQQLTVMKMDISWMKKKINAGDTEVVPPKMDELMELLDGTVASVRRISTELRPSLLDDIGLIATIEWQAELFTKRTGIPIKLEIANDLQIPDEHTTGLFRIIQESLTNIARHANASQIVIHLENNKKEFILYIEDNGVGFDKNQSTQIKTLGLLGMKERTLMMKGEFLIESKPNSGTMVKVRVPLS
ncbi:PAS domain S-box protein [Lacibacter sp. H407]|uniref:PAS domain S-box protein n=1 Tax=Lacibacter sp. H407 TaxID=3133423 RepID=UPI0030C220F3